MFLKVRTLEYTATSINNIPVLESISGIVFDFDSS